MAATRFASLDELRAAEGRHLGYSDWHEITQDRVNAFADATGDHQWIHVDPERAAQGPFGGPIAHGFLTLSLAPWLVGEVYAVDGVRMGVNYGLNKVRFTAPVPVGAKVRAGAELLTVRERGGMVEVIAKVTFEVEGGDKPACVAETVTLYQN